MKVEMSAFADSFTVGLKEKGKSRILNQSSRKQVKHSKVMDYLQSYGNFKMIPAGMVNYPGTLNSRKLLPTFALKVKWSNNFQFKILFREVRESSKYF